MVEFYVNLFFSVSLKNSYVFFMMKIFNKKKEFFVIVSSD